MFKKDFILRMIEMLAELIAGILGLIKKGDFEQASHKLDKAYTEFLNEDASLFINIPKDKLTQSLLKEHHYENGHLEILAELFFVEAELRFAQQKYFDSKEFYEKSLLLHEFVEKETRSYSLERQSKIKTIQQRIHQIVNTDGK
jgi:hypothetical protein